MHFDRLRVVSVLPPDGGWRADLAVDRAGAPPRAVLVARVPPFVAGDALALATLARGLDLCARIQHPALRRLLGTGEVDGDLVLVEAWREGETLRAVRDAGGPLEEPLVARIGVEVAGALHAGHGIPASMGRPLCHGAVSAERVLLAEDGQVLLCGLGRPFGVNVTPEDDLRGLARLMLECLPSPGAEGPGPLEAICHRVLVGEGYPSAAEFAVAVAAAVTPADAAAVAARLEASLPEGRPSWLAHRRALAQALRAEDGAAAEEVAHSEELAELGRDEPVVSPEAPPEPAVQLAPPPDPAAPAHTPPPIPPGAGAVTPPAPAMPPAVDEPAPRAEEPAPPAAPGVTGTEQFVEVVRAVPGRDGPLFLETPPGAFQAWLQHPQTPVAVGAALGLLGFAIGFVLGGR